MEKSEADKSIQFDLEVGQNNNKNSSSDINSKSHWTEEQEVLLLESPSSGADDSGHFTISPETDASCTSHSGSSRGHSPLTFQENPPPSPPTSAMLVQQVCRDQQNKCSNERQPSSTTLETMSMPNSNLKGPVHLKSAVSSRVSSNNSIRDPDRLSSPMPTSGEGDKGSSHSSEYLRTVLDNFNDLYKEKLKIIEDAGAQGDACTKQVMMEKKATILECWAKDVCVQNIFLIHTVEELEKQADEKLSLLQKKIHESTNLARQHVSVIQKYESEARSLIKDKETSKEAQKELKRELDKLKSEYKRVRERIKDLEKDNDGLVTLVARIRDMGVWDISGLELHKRTFDHIFGLYPNLPGSEVQTVFTREKLRRIQETDNKVQQLEVEISELNELKNKSDIALKSKDSKLVELENEFKLVSNKLQHCQDECEHYKISLIDTQEKLLEATKELQAWSKKNSRANTPNAADAARHAEIQELLQELRIVKAQLNESVHESQSAKLESSMIRKEFNDRLQSMQDSQQSLQSELTHSFETHNQIQEREAQLLKVNEQVKSYQSKCKAAEQMLNKKDHMIADLQKQVRQLNKKEALVKHVFDKPILTCGRNHLHKVQNQSNTYPVIMSKMSKNQKPPWNEHFVKVSAPETSSNLTFPLSKNIIESNEHMKRTCHSKSKSSKVLHSSTNNTTKDSFSFCSCGSQDVLTEPVRSFDIINNSSGISLPKIDHKFDLKAEIQKLKDLKSQYGVGTGKFPPLPQISHTKSKILPPSSPRNRDPPSFPKVDNPFAHASAYGILMDIAVEASKKMLASTDEAGPNNQVSSIRVVAGHSKGSNGTKVEKENPSHGRSKHRHNHTKLPKNHASNVIEESCDTDHQRHHSRTESKLDNKPQINSKISPSLEDLLSELPEQSFMNVVQDWMNKSSESQFNAIGRSKSSKTLIHDPTVKVSKQRSLKKTPRQSSGKSSSSMMFTAKKSKKKIVKDISDIKEEWNRVFENLDENISRNSAGDSHFKEDSSTESSEVTIDDLSVTYSTHSLKNLDDENSNFVTTPVLTPTSRESSFDIDSQPESKTDQIVVEKLRKEFQAEKAKMEEDFQKELKDKDIEITMQKVTIQHLQGALVALKRGQPYIPIPQSSIAKSNGNGGVNNCGKVFEI